MKHLWGLTGILFLAMISLSGCGDKEPANMGQLFQPGQAQGFNILLVTLDTVRQDRLGCYGYKKAQTPTIDSLAAGGVQYYDAVSSVPLTLPSHATIMTGQTPLNHGVRDNGLYALGSEPSTLAEDLHNAGYATAAFIGSFVLDKRFGLDRGFDHYDFQVSESGYRPKMADFNERPANEVTDATLSWLKEHQVNQPDQPFFAWVHYFDAHLPYTSPLQNDPAFINRGYDAEISFTDSQLKRLIDWLDASDVRENTVIILTSDHGESLGEHQEATHGMFIYNSTMKVPLVVNCPSLIFRHLAVKNTLAGLIDLRSTISEMVAVRPSAVLDGYSLLQPISPDRIVYMESESPLNMAGCSPLSGLQSHYDKYIRAPKSEYYNLVDDPDELNNLHNTHHEQVAPLATSLQSLLGQADSKPATDRHITSEEADRLRSLGYVHSGARDTTGERPDPKDMIEIFNAGLKTEKLYSQGKFAEAADLAERVIARCESCVVAIRVLAFSKIRLGQGEEAVTLLKNAVDQTGDLFLVRSLAQAQIIGKDFPGALQTLELFQALDPHDGRVFILRGDVYDKQGKGSLALKEYQKALILDENRSGIRAQQRIQRIQSRSD
ncbi:MAG: sulfatase-like hydrolase/transferase [bacterium]|nr:sulfatase-like hydrolase/transferase [bacterium]